MQLDEEALWARKAKPALAELKGVVLHIRGDGTLPGALKALKASLPEREASDGGGGGEGAKRSLPEVLVRDMRVIDHGGALQVEKIGLTWAAGRLIGRMEVVKPPIGPCSFRGSTIELEIVCDKAVRQALPAGLSVRARKLELRRKPTPVAKVKGVRLETEQAGGLVHAMFRGVSVDATLHLLADEKGARRIEARLSLPGGGHIDGAGTARPEHVEFRLEVEDLPLDPVHPTIKGGASAKLRVEASRAERRLTVEGQASLNDFSVDHRALADERIGPFGLDIGGRLELKLPEGLPPTRAHLRLTRGRARVGMVDASLELDYDRRPEQPVLRAEFKIPPINAPAVVESIPPGLMADLQPIRAIGPVSLGAKLEVDWAKLKKTKLDIDVDLDDLKIMGLNPAIDFEGLRDVFRTHFEMPDGEIISRTTGPESERWTAIEDMPDLLPLAVVTQEDGGFYRHEGVSLLHLRGSLIRNLQRGRFARGGSTLTMQLARNLFLNRRKTLSRKLQELVLTAQLEHHFEKDELMALYLNVVEFGPEIFGIGDAAQHYFQKPVWALTPAEMVYLTRLLPGPRLHYYQFERRRLDGYYKKRMDRLLALLVDRGHLAQADYDAQDLDALWAAEQEDVP